MKGRLHHFVEGDMTIREFIDTHAPCLPVSTVRAHLEAGRNSAKLMLTYSHNSQLSGAKSAGFRLGRKPKARFGSKPSRFR